MKNKFLKKGLITLGILALLLLAALVVVPFFITVSPLENLASPEQVAFETSKFVTIPFEGTDGIELHYLEAKAESGGYTFVLLHGSNFNAFTWNEVIDEFAEYGRVVAYDQISYGLSEKLVEGDWTEANPYTPNAAVEQLFLFLDALDIDKAVLVGNSYGSTLAVQAALENPERIEALILSDAAVYVQEEMPAWLMNSPQMQRVGLLFARELGQSEAFIKMTYLAPEKITEERMSLTMIHTQVTNWDVAYWEYLQAWYTGDYDYISMLPEIDQPALVISGDSDNVVPLSDSERLNNELPNSELIVLPNCGHVPQEECPTAFVEASEVWLTQNLVTEIP